MVLVCVFLREGGTVEKMVVIVNSDIGGLLKVRTWFD